MKKINSRNDNYNFELEKIKNSVINLNKNDPIRILFENYLLFTEDTNNKNEIKKIITYINSYIKNSDLNSSEIIKELAIFRDWRRKYLLENLDGNKLLEFIENNKLNKYIFISRYYNILPIRLVNDLNTPLRTDKGFDKLHNLYRDYLKLDYGEDYVKDIPIL